MGHGTAAGFPLNAFLQKVFHADVGPDVAAEIKQNGVDPAYGIEMSCKQIVMFYLRGVLLPLQAQSFFQKLVGEALPVIFREGGMVCIEIAGGASEFSGEGDVYEKGQLVFDAFGEYHQLFSHTGG